MVGTNEPGHAKRWVVVFPNNPENSRKWREH